MALRPIIPTIPEGAYIANPTAQEAAGLPIFAFNPDGEPIDIINHYVNSRNDTAFVIERRVAGSTNPWTTIATVQSSQLGVVALPTPTRSGTRTPLFEYQVYAINVVGDVWDHSNPAFNEIPPGGGFPTLTLDSRGGATTTVAAPTGHAGSAVAKNKKAATVTLRWTDNSANESGFLVQRADNAAFTVNVSNSATAADVTTFTQDAARATTFYYRVLAFNDAHQSDWSNTATVTTP